MKLVTDRDNTGSVAYSSQIIADIVYCSLNEVNGVVQYKDGEKKIADIVKIDQVGDEMYIDVYVKLMHNVSVTDVASNLQSTVKATIENMTEFKVHDVNIHVVDVEFETED